MIGSLTDEHPGIGEVVFLASRTLSTPTTPALLSVYAIHPVSHVMANDFTFPEAILTAPTPAPVLMTGGGVGGTMAMVVQDGTETTTLVLAVGGRGGTNFKIYNAGSTGFG